SISRKGAKRRVRRKGKFALPISLPTTSAIYSTLHRPVIPTTDYRRSFMRKFFVTIAFICGVLFTTTTTSQAQNEMARWQQHARNVTITRDNWGIAHVHGKTDADAVFGMIYAQAEDDFNRVETNFINAQGRLAEAEGESAIWQD